MKRIGYSVLTVLAFATIAGSANLASATPTPNGAVITTRIFNDCPGSSISTNNAYPGVIGIADGGSGCGGFANRHAWSFSADGGATPIAFVNGDKFSYCATLNISGSGAEGGLRLSPWWSPDVDGNFNCRTTDGEVACFGGRLPFYSFTGTYGLRYLPGTPITLMIDYDPHQVSFLDPATIVYTVTYGANTYTSGPLAFDHANPAEDPPHGVWGILSPARVGGHLQIFLPKDANNDPTFGPFGVEATWSNICFDAGPTPANNTTWGKIKANYR